MTKFGELITSKLHTAYAIVADAACALGYLENVEQRKEIGHAVGKALSVFEEELKRQGVYDIQVDVGHAAVIVQKAAERTVDSISIVDPLERESLLRKAIVNRPRTVNAATSIDVWSAGRTADRGNAVRHPIEYGGETDHPDFKVSRPLEGEEREQNFIQKGSLGTDDAVYPAGSSDPTVFEDGPLQSDSIDGGLREEDTIPPTSIGRKSDPASNPPIHIVASTGDAPGHEAHGQQRSLRPDVDTDSRGAPVKLSVGSADALALAELHKTMYRRALNDPKFELAVVRRGPDGSLELLG